MKYKVHVDHVVLADTTFESVRAMGDTRVQTHVRRAFRAKGAGGRHTRIGRI